MWEVVQFLVQTNPIQQKKREGEEFDRNKGTSTPTRLHAMIKGCHKRRECWRSAVRRQGTAKGCLDGLHWRTISLIQGRSNLSISLPLLLKPHHSSSWSTTEMPPFSFFLTFDNHRIEAFKLPSPQPSFSLPNSPISSSLGLFCGIRQHRLSHHPIGYCHHHHQHLR